MPYTIYLTSSAIADVTMAKEYYNSKVDGLGRRMTSEVDMMLSKIADMPYVYSKRYVSIRAARVPSFPYLI